MSVWRGDERDKGAWRWRCWCCCSASHKVQAQGERKIKEGAMGPRLAAGKSTQAPGGHLAPSAEAVSVPVPAPAVIVEAICQPDSWCSWCRCRCCWLHAWAAANALSDSTARLSNHHRSSASASTHHLTSRARTEVSVSVNSDPPAQEQTEHVRARSSTAQVDNSSPWLSLGDHRKRLPDRPT